MNPVSIEKNMKVLIVGGGGREHVILDMISRSKHEPRLYAAPGNSGMEKLAKCVNISVMDFEGIRDYCLNEKIDFVIVSPDDPLSGGLVDVLEKAGLSCFGPRGNAAQIEGSKAFAKNFMKEEKIPTANFEIVENYEDAKAFVDGYKDEDFPLVVKVDGLALGKGVYICQDRKKAEEAINDIMLDKKFGESGNKIVFEEFLTGPEITLLCFTDGTRVYPLLSSMDHKTVYEGNKGPNTGGMGVVAPNPFFTKEVEEEVFEKIVNPTVLGMKRIGREFRGCLYVGLMATPKGVKVIEYNCRFGDPEAECILPLLESDLLEMMVDISNGELNYAPKFKKGYSATVMVCSGGYPVKYEKGKTITFDGGEESILSDVQEIYHSGTKWKDEEKNQYATNGGRVLACCAQAETMERAISMAYDIAKKVNFEGAFYRKDIGDEAMKEILRNGGK